MARLLITGASGFLGSSLLKGLDPSHDILATRRASSGFQRLGHLAEAMQWIDMERADWKARTRDFAPEVIIHAAWLGVEAKDRDNNATQEANLHLWEDLLHIAGEAGTKKVIGFGSQAEYGDFSGVGVEDAELNPLTVYGRTKIKCADMLRAFCTAGGVDWYWLRLFSFFGEGQGDDWLIPSAIRHILSGTEMSLTEGLQKYAYFYAGDLGAVIEQILRVQGASGIYNISGREPMSVRDLLERIRDKTNPSYALKFGTLPYRPGQPMFVAGDMGKFARQIGTVVETPFGDALDKTIQSYARLYKHLGT